MSYSNSDIIISHNFSSFVAALLSDLMLYDRALSVVLIFFVIRVMWPIFFSSIFSTMLLGQIKLICHQNLSLGDKSTKFDTILFQGVLLEKKCTLSSYISKIATSSQRGRLDKCKKKKKGTEQKCIIDPKDQNECILTGKTHLCQMNVNMAASFQDGGYYMTQNEHFRKLSDHR